MLASCIVTIYSTVLRECLASCIVTIYSTVLRECVLASCIVTIYSTVLLWYLTFQLQTGVEWPGLFYCTSSLSPKTTKRKYFHMKPTSLVVVYLNYGDIFIIL